MQVTGFGSSAAAWLASIGKTTDAPTRLDVSLPEYDGKIERAEVAVPRMSFPTAPPVNLGAEALLALQDAGAAPAQSAPTSLAAEAETDDLAPSSADEFLDYMKKTPEERLRDKILKALGITEDDIKDMSMDERMALEDKIREIIKETMVKAEGVGEPDEASRGVTESQQFLLQQV